MIQIKTWLISFLLCLIPVIVFTQENRFINYTVDDGLAQAYVYNFTQDNDGNLWIGTGNGLSCFDGYSFANFTEQDSLGGNFITCGLKAKDGLWFGHFNGSLSYYDGEVFKPIQNAQKGFGSVVDIQEGAEGEIWFANQNGGFKKINSKNQLSKSYKTAFSQPIFTFLFISTDQMLVGTSEGLSLCKINPIVGVEEKYKYSELIENKIVDIIKSSKPNIYYILTEDEGVFQLNYNNGKHNIELITKSTNCSRAQNVFEDTNGNLWVSCLSNGLFKISLSEKDSKHSILRYGESNGLQTDAIKAVFEDREGNIWIGKYGGGLSRLVPSSNSFISFNSELFSNDIHSICLSEKFKWVGTDKELLKCNLETNKVIASFDVNGNLPNDKITALCDRNNKELWIGTEKSGVYRLDYQSGKIYSQFLRLGNLEKSISSIVIDQQHVWIGTQKGVCRFNPINNDKKWYTLREEGLPHNSVNHLFKAKDNKIWVGTLSNTLSYIQNGILTNLNLSSGSNLLNISSIVEDNNGAIWVGTNGSGVYVVNQDSTLNLNFQHGLLSDYCYSLNLDNNRIWVTHRGGISQIKVSDYHIKTIQKNAGIRQSVEFNKNSSIAFDEILWFGSNKGIYQYDVSKEVKRHISPTLKIGSININGDEYSTKDKIVLPSGNYKVHISFKGISLNEPESINYKFKLEGYDHDWSRYETQRNTEYKQLGSGDYIFKLKALTANGVESEKPLLFEIKVRYPLWQKAWFQIAALIFLFFGIYLFIILREKNLRRIQQKLIQNLDDKTREVIAKEEVIKERKRTEKELIIAKNKAEESDRLKTAFLSNMSHEIRTPLNAIVGFSTMLQEPNVNPSSKGRYMSILKSNTNDLLCLIDDIMDISSIEAGQLKLKIQDCDVDKILSELKSVHAKKITDLKLENLELVYLSKDTDITIKSDPLRLKQILSNLIGNAIKFTEKGTIEFGCELISTNKIKFFVRDTGIGINADQIEVIFERFRKEQRNGWNKLYRGAGLGLAISKSMVKLLGGEIGVESLQGVGSYFYFILPIESKQ